MHGSKKLSLSPQKEIGLPPVLLPNELSTELTLSANGRNNSQQCWDLQCIVGTIQPISLCKMRNERAWPQQCCKSCANGSNIVALRFSDHGTKEMLGVAEKFDRFQTLRNNTQQHPTTCNRVCKRTQHVTSNNVGSCWPTMLRPFARGLMVETAHLLD